jgi:ParB-like chromosome segregation protein Spo0J
VRQDLGDLRSLTNSIKKYGIMQPIVVERYGRDLRLRAGHRRLAAAKIAGLAKIPAVIHPEALDDRDWIEQAIQENEQRRNIDQAERRRAAEALHRLGCTWSGIAETFGVAESTLHRWFQDEQSTLPSKPKPVPGYRDRAIKRLIAAHRSEYRALLQEEKFSAPRKGRDEVDEVVVERCLNGERLDTTKAEREEVIARWKESGRSLNELSRIFPSWNIWRDLRGAA